MANASLDSSAAWKDAVALFKSNRETAMAIAGVFILLPLLAFGWFSSQMNFDGLTTPEQIIAVAREWMAANWYWLFAISIFSGYGALAINNSALDLDRPTVAESLRAAAVLFPAYFVTIVVVGIATGIGFILFILPGIYLSIKWLFVPTVMAAERLANPIEAMRRSWRLTSGNSFTIFLFVFVVVIATTIIRILLEVVIGLPTLLLPADIMQAVNLLVSSILQTFVSVLILFVYMAIYRQLSANQANA